MSQPIKVPLQYVEVSQQQLEQLRPSTEPSVSMLFALLMRVSEITQQLIRSKLLAPEVAREAFAQLRTTHFPETTVKLSQIEVEVLEIVGAQTEVSLETIAKRTCMASASVNVILLTLLRKKLIARRIDGGIAFFGLTARAEHLRTGGSSGAAPVVTHPGSLIPNPLLREQSRTKGTPHGPRRSR